MRVYQFRHLGLACMLWTCRTAASLPSRKKVRSIARFLKKRKSPLSKRSKKNSNTADVAGAMDLPPDFDPEVPSRETIMQQLRAFGKPMAQEALARACGATVPLSVGFERRLRAMERDGQLFMNRQSKVQINDKLEFIAGRVQGHRDGFGFLLRDDGGPDLFLSPREMLKVLHGDRVLAKIEGEYKGKLEGTIVEVSERRTDKLVGRFLRERGSGIVVPEDQRIKHDILIPPQEINGAEHGQVVSAQIIQQPTRHTQPLGRVVEVLGEIDDRAWKSKLPCASLVSRTNFPKAHKSRLRNFPITFKMRKSKAVSTCAMFPSSRLMAKMRAISTMRCFACRSIWEPKSVGAKVGDFWSLLQMSAITCGLVRQSMWMHWSAARVCTSRAASSPCCRKPYRTAFVR